MALRGAHPGSRGGGTVSRFPPPTAGLPPEPTRPGSACRSSALAELDHHLGVWPTWSCEQDGLRLGDRAEHLRHVVAQGRSRSPSPPDAPRRVTNAAMAWPDVSSLRPTTAASATASCETSADSTSAVEIRCPASSSRRRHVRGSRCRRPRPAWRRPPRSTDPRTARSTCRGSAAGLPRRRAACPATGGRWSGSRRLPR